MPRVQLPQKTLEARKRIARTTKQWLVRLMALLVMIALILIFGIGQAIWPAWMIAHRTQMIGGVLLILFIVVLISPVIIEANSNPRPLSGPGKDPRKGWDP